MKKHKKMFYKMMDEIDSYTYMLIRENKHLKGEQLNKFIRRKINKKFEVQNRNIIYSFISSKFFVEGVH